MNAHRKIASRGGHLDRNHAFDINSRAVADNADAQHTFGPRLDEDFGQSLLPAQGGGTAGRGPRETQHRNLLALLFGLRFGEPAPGDLRIGKHDGWNRPYVPDRRFAMNHFDGEPALGARLVGQHRLAGRVADGEDMPG